MDDRVDPRRGWPADLKALVQGLTRASAEERIAFPAVVRALQEAGVERYHADLVQGTVTYFLPDGSFEITHGHATGAAAAGFRAEGVAAAVRAIQRGEIGYRGFCDRIAAAGCVGYLVSLLGRQATYYGRDNGVHVEWFPGAGP